MSEERFEVFGNIIKDNKDIPALLDNYQATVRLNELNDKVKELEQELAEKQNTIDEINKEFVQAVHDWKALCAEKDKEIEKLKQQYTILENENGKLTTDLIMDKYKKARKEVSFGEQLAVSELEKVREFMNETYGYDCCADVSVVDTFINQQIKELKGEKK